jgi:O-antigen/teichoic acid export membrane protein
MRKLIAQTFAIQGIGVGLMFALTLLVSRLGGPEAQGSFALVKSATDLLVGIFSLGLPSAIIYLLNKSGSGHGIVYRLSIQYGLVLALILPIITGAAIIFSGTESNINSVIMRSTVIGFAAALLTQLALLRAVLLVCTDGPLFSTLAIVQWLVLGVVALPLLHANVYAFEIAYCASGAACLLLVKLYLRHFGIRASITVRKGQSLLDWSVLYKQSGHVFIQTALFALQPFLTNAALARYDTSLTIAGLFNIASMVITLPNLLVALVAPVLFNRWSKSLDWVGMAAVVRNAWWIGIAGQLLALAALPSVGPVIIFIFGDQFVAATEATQIMLLATFAVITGRILTPALQGLGLTHVATWSCLCRMLVGLLTAIVVLCSGISSPLASMAIAWCASEYAALGILLLRVRRGRQLQ